MKIGLLARAAQSKRITDESQIKEEIQLAWNGVQVDGITNGWNNTTKAGALNTELLKKDGNASASWNTVDSVINVTYKGYETTIAPNSGTITEIAKIDNNNNNGNSDNEDDVYRGLLTPQDQIIQDLFYYEILTNPTTAFNTHHIGKNYLLLFK